MKFKVGDKVKHKEYGLEKLFILNEEANGICPMQLNV